MTYIDLVKNKVNSDIEKILKNPFKNIPCIEESISISKKYNIALHPRYLFYWNELTAANLIIFLEFLKKIKLKFTEKNEIKFSYLPLEKDQKRIIEKLGIEHSIKTLSIDKAKSEEEINLIIINLLNTKILFSNLGFENFNFEKKIIEEKINLIIKFAEKNLSLDSCKILSSISKIEIKDKYRVVEKSRVFNNSKF